ncbi:arginine--tRNA ligase [Candidatus Woesearchaeota archaeon]|nr:arginine--tRNA ligase [Candidatus Woesearchaeota archaeon]MBT4110990.1 arginine--tRNA ligase [Candidatus Woesearchaeota archaeon]MBT4336859.1 arginine--tRNA ligase [Candidatus Woesearchaeota archaeon]MBT4469826.1 arginine--tRNA ligase [Candidatus Woesearchaeota archaeon]MBT6743703.1 arginine--tRNA ligase [Candidatus Woesearchaeota archaeon]
MDFKAEIIKLLTKETKLKDADLNNLISIPPDPKLGDYAFPCFKLGSNPKNAAETLKKKLKLPKFLSGVQVVGPYLNFYVKSEVITKEVLTKVFKEKKDYGKQELGEGKKIVIDFSAPNIAKPFGIGHLRSTVIGHSLYKVYNTLGYKSIGINHLGDWGTQFGKLIVAYKKWGKEKELGKDPIKYLLKLYVQFHEEAEKDDKLDDQAREAFKKLEDGNKEYLQLWEHFRELSLKEFQRIYQILDVKFDSYHGEAFYNNILDKTIKELQQKIKTKMSDGALIVDLEEFNMSPVMLKKSNGATTYHTRDIAAANYRLKKYNPNRFLYVVGSEQKLHFRQLFKVLELAGEDKEKFTHADFGLFRFPEGKMSTRKGKVIFLEDVLDKAIKLASEIIEKKNPDLKNKKKVAIQVGVGAIIFADLSNDRTRNIDFDWDRMLSFDGETGPYLQYTHARASSILRKANSKVSSKINFSLLSLDEEKAVIRLLYDFPERIVKAAETYKPHHIANHLISLAQAFNEFYHKCPVISERDEQMNARLLLVDSVRQVLENGLRLLGIKAPDEM